MATQATETAQGGSPIPVVSVSSPSSLLSAAHDTGFLYLALPTAEPKPRKVGPTEQQVADMFKLSAKFFTSDSDKSKFIVPGSYFGFHSEEKKTGYEPWDSIGLNKKGSYDFKATMNFPVHGMPDFSGWYADKTGSIPDIFKENWKQVNDFCKACHELAEETLRSLADALGLPDRDYLVKRHLASEPSGTYLRLLYYVSARSGVDRSQT